MSKHQNERYGNSDRIGLTVAILLGGVLGLTGCAPVGPDYSTPHVDLPAGYNNVFNEIKGQETSGLSSWWQQLNDPTLSHLIEQAIQNNLDAKQAASRVRAARLRWMKSGSGLYPTLDSSASLRKSESRDETGLSIASESWAAGFDASWELDIFGGTRRSQEAAQGITRQKSTT